MQWINLILAHWTESESESESYVEQDIEYRQ